MEQSRQILSLADFTGVATTFRGFQTGDKCEIGFGFAAMITQASGGFTEQQYMRKTEGFARNLRGANKVELENGATRYMKNGYYLIKDEAGKIIGFGKIK